MKRLYRDMCRWDRASSWSTHATSASTCGYCKKVKSKREKNTKTVNSVLRREKEKIYPFSAMTKVPLPAEKWEGTFWRAISGEKRVCWRLTNAFTGIWGVFIWDKTERQRNPKNEHNRINDPDRVNRRFFNGCDR